MSCECFHISANFLVTVLIQIQLLQSHISVTAVTRMCKSYCLVNLRHLLRVHRLLTYLLWCDCTSTADLFHFSNRNRLHSIKHHLHGSVRSATEHSTSLQQQLAIRSEVIKLSPIIQDYSSIPICFFASFLQITLRKCKVTEVLGIFAFYILM